jgi:hypothetical protein
VDPERTNGFPEPPEHGENDEQEPHALARSVDPHGPDHGSFNCD